MDAELARKQTRLISRLPLSSRLRWSLLVSSALLVLSLMSSGCQTMQVFKDASKTKVTSARNWARSGFDAMHQGRFQQAKTFFSKAAKEMPGDYRIMANLARSEFQQGDVDRAISVMEQAVDRSDDAKLRCELGEMYLKTGRWLAANQHADKAIERERHLADAWKLKGKLADTKGDHQLALQLYQRALGYENESDEIQMLIAHAYMEMEQPMRALSATETLLNRHPPDRQPESAIVAKSEALMAMHQHPAAIEILNTASNRPDSSKEIFFQLGKAHLLVGNQTEARQVLARGQERFPAEVLFDELAATISSEYESFGFPDNSSAETHHVASVKPDELTK